MGEWEGTCPGCFSRWRLQMLDGPDPAPDEVIEVPCPAIAVAHHWVPWALSQVRFKRVREAVG